MKNNSIFNQLHAQASQFVESFLTDFDIDKKTIKKYEGVKFIHISRKTGTSLSMFYKPDQYPKLNETVSYFFGTNASRRKILKDIRMSLHFYLENSPLNIVYFDGKKLNKITAVKARKLMQDYYNSLSLIWDEEERTINNSITKI